MPAPAELTTVGPLPRSPLRRTMRRSALNPSPLVAAACAFRRCAEDHADDADQGRAVLVVLASAFKPTVLRDLLDATDTGGSTHIDIPEPAYDALMRVAA